MGVVDFCPFGARSIPVKTPDDEIAINAGSHEQPPQVYRAKELN